MSSIRCGGCLCGATRYEVSGKEEFTIQCYCRDCQRISGGGNLPMFIVKQENISLTGALKYFSRKTDSGNDQKIGFCDQCGSSICSTISKMSEKIFVVAGSLDEPATFSTNTKIYESSRQPWDNS